MTVLLRGATLADGGIVDVRLDGHRIAEVAPTLSATADDEQLDLSGHVLLPAPAEPHAHFDKALTADRIPNAAGDLLGAIDAWRAHRPHLTIDDIADRAERAARMLAGNGVTAVRTHVDVAADIGTTGVEALIKVREAVADLLEIQIVALVSPPISGPDGEPNRRALDAAMAAGADIVGGCPHLEPDPAAAIAHVLRVATAAGTPIDLHMDETLEPDVLQLRILAAAVTTAGFPHAVTASHCCSLGVQRAAVQHQVAAAVAAARMAVVALPQTNLFLQARGQTTAPPRGLTALRALLGAGVTVAGGSDNLQDPFNPVGRGDPLETASLLVTAGHLSITEAYAAVSTGARAAMGLEPVAVVPGAPAELLAVPAGSLREAVAVAPPGRTVIHRGRVRRR